MYVNCIFCRAHLGTNQLIENFPVGRQLAFDGAKGRLWVVCRACLKWNLTPLEERWEAIEECERIYESTRARVSTGQIGLARTTEGMQLIRIGSPVLPEFAAWRYGEQFKRRRKRSLAITGSVVVAGAGMYFFALPALAISVGGMTVWNAYSVVHAIRGRVVDARVPTGQHSLRKFVDVRRRDLAKVELHRTDDGKDLLLHVRSGGEEWNLKGDNAVNGLRHILPPLNRKGGSANDIQDAVQAIERGHDPRRFMLTMAKKRAHSVHTLSELEPEQRLALEMIVNEERERAALEGELAVLEAAWKDAEEIANIADNMFIPDRITQFIDRARAARDQKRDA